jgi:hypothetical protein
MLIQNFDRKNLERKPFGTSSAMPACEDHFETCNKKLSRECVNWVQLAWRRMVSSCQHELCNPVSVAS